eukprot:2634184-Alexandrium_andersonii.AAC.1
MFDHDTDRARAAAAAEILWLLWTERYDHKRNRVESGLSDEEVWNALIQEVRSQHYGPWRKEWMAEQRAERLGFAQAVAGDDKAERDKM